jgi:hypothetical protein
MNGGAFIAHIDDADSLAGDVIPDWLDMPTLQSENSIDATGLEEARNPGRAGLLIRIEILRLDCGLAHELTPVDVYFVRRTRCRIFPVAVRGMSSSAMNDIDRGRL